MRGASAGSAELQNAAVNLNIEGEDMAADIGQHIRFDQNIPEALGVFMTYFALIRAGKSVDWEDRMMAEDDLVADIAVCLQRCLEPLGLNVASPPRPVHSVWTKTSRRSPRRTQ
jgi:hypothetical protein